MFLDDVWAHVIPNYRVLHAIPGRMRIHVPLSKKLAAEWGLQLDQLGLADRIPGLNGIHFNPTTGTALITYEPERLSQEQILKLLDEIAGLLRRHRHELAAFKPKQRAQAMQYALRLVETHLDWLDCKDDDTP